MALVIEDVSELPEGFIPLKAIVIIECLTPDGKRSLAIRSNESTPLWDEVGMLAAAMQQRMNDLSENWESEG